MSGGCYINSWHCLVVHPLGMVALLCRLLFGRVSWTEKKKNGQRFLVDDSRVQGRCQIEQGPWKSTEISVSRQGWGDGTIIQLNLLHPVAHIGAVKSGRDHRSTEHPGRCRWRKAAGASCTKAVAEENFSRSSEVGSVPLARSTGIASGASRRAAIPHARLPPCLQTAFAQGAVFLPRFASGLPHPFGSLGLPLPTAPFPGGPDPAPSHHGDGVGREGFSTRFPAGLLGPFGFAFRLVKSPKQVLRAEALRMPLKKQMIFLFCFLPQR